MSCCSCAWLLAPSPAVAPVRARAFVPASVRWGRHRCRMPMPVHIERYMVATQGDLEALEAHGDMWAALDVLGHWAAHISSRRAVDRLKCSLDLAMSQRIRKSREPPRSRAPRPTARRWRRSMRAVTAPTKATELPVAGDAASGPMAASQCKTATTACACVAGAVVKPRCRRAVALRGGLGLRRAPAARPSAWACGSGCPRAASRARSMLVVLPHWPTPWGEWGGFYRMAKTSPTRLLRAR